MDSTVSQRIPKHGWNIAAAIYDLAENKRVQPRAKLIAEFAGCSERQAQAAEVVTQLWKAGRVVSGQRNCAKSERMGSS